jgi:hypothetical protein
MNRQNSLLFPLAHFLLFQMSLVADLARSLGHIRFHPVTVQEATKGCSAETNSRPITTTNLPINLTGTFPVNEDGRDE